MRTRHWLSMLFLRQGLLWEGSAWTQAHEHWLAAQRFEAHCLHAYDEGRAAVQRESAARHSRCGDRR
jgi:hypothetical protein